MATAGVLVIILLGSLLMVYVWRRYRNRIKPTPSTPTSNRNKLPYDDLIHQFQRNSRKNLDSFLSALTGKEHTDGS